MKGSRAVESRTRSLKSTLWMDYLGLLKAGIPQVPEKSGALEHIDQESAWTDRSPVGIVLRRMKTAGICKTAKMRSDTGKLITPNASGNNDVARMKRQKSTASDGRPTFRSRQATQIVHKTQRSRAPVSKPRSGTHDLGPRPASPRNRCITYHSPAINTVYTANSTPSSEGSGRAAWLPCNAVDTVASCMLASWALGPPRGGRLLKKMVGT